MPDELGKLSEEELERFSVWLFRVWTEDNQKCPVSGHREWAINQHVVSLIPHGGSILHPESVYPFVMVMCNACGYTTFFNAVLAGIVQKKVQPDG